MSILLVLYHAVVWSKIRQLSDSKSQSNRRIIGEIENKEKIDWNRVFSDAAKVLGIVGSVIGLAIVLARTIMEVLGSEEKGT